MTRPVLKTVTGELPDPPYPADTKIRGWRYELDHERINQSDTWALAQPDMKPWLLMIWFVSWQQHPAGSLPSNQTIIAAKIGMDPRLFEAHSDILLRGWVRHSDDRLYHPVVTERIRDYLDKRKAEADRKAAYRAKLKRQMSHGTDAGQGGDGRGSDATSTSTSTSTSTNNNKRTKKPDVDPVADEFNAIWPGYPQRSGNNPKQAALKAYRARRKDHSEGVIKRQIDRYAKFCKETDRLQTEYVQMASTFLGASFDPDNEWAPPKPQPQSGGGSKGGQIDLSNPAAVEAAYRTHLGKSSPAGKSLDECRAIFWQRYNALTRTA